MIAKSIFLKTLKIILLVLAVYGIYFLVISTVPHLLQKKVSEDSRARFSEVSFSGGSEPWGDRITLVEDIRSAFEIRMEMLRHAEVSLDIVYHTLHTGETTRAFFGEVLLAADRGVVVRILLDGKVAVTERETAGILQTLNGHPNISCRLYNPLDFFRPWKTHALLHDKFILTDGTLLLLGGRNIGDKYYAPENYTGAVTNDRDVLVWRPSPDIPGVADQVSEYLDLLWNGPDASAWKNKKSPAVPAAQAEALRKAPAFFEKEHPEYFQCTLDDYLAGMVPASKITLINNPIHTGSKEPWLGYQLRELALQASESVLIQTPYATGNKHLLGALKEVNAAADVVLLTNSMASSPNFPAFSNYITRRKKFIATGIAILEYQHNDSIHGKSLIIDKRLSAVGSFNMDDRSFYIDTETMLIIDSPEFAGLLEEAMNRYMASSLPVGQDNRYILSSEVEALKVPWPKKTLMLLVSLFSRPFQFLI